MPSSRLRLFLRAVLSLAFFIGMVAAPRTASAYPWMIRHEYTHCTQCHMDPSGAGLLTPYGRAQGEILLRTQYGEPSDDEEARAKYGRFLWGVPLPDGIALQGDLRDALLVTKIPGSPATTRAIQMVADLGAGLNFARFRASGALGYVHDGALPAALTHAPKDNLVSRYYWAGVALGEDENILLRAGRINMPYGLRNPEHTLQVRSLTRTDYNQAQQHGVAASYDGDWLRGELMAIVGNYQVNPDAYRERGYAGYLEASVASRVAFGVSSLVTYAKQDINLNVADLRQAHGVFGRAAIVKPLVLMAEADVLHDSPKGAKAYTGYAALVQADYEAIQGLHFMATGEVGDGGGANGARTSSAWLSSAWFFISHADVRVDGIYQNVHVATTTVNGFSFLAQLHVYL